jgi:hypothetical protein
MNYLLILAALPALIESLDAFKLPTASMERRHMLKLIPTLTLVSPVICKAQEPENNPLTPEEMEEYERLLEEAKKIQSIIDSNIKAANDEFEKQLRELKKK